MLQWMGGSRRKVNASRKSTHTRQKQYFEQKKRRQQQQHQQSGMGSFIGGVDTHRPCRKDHYRSLDILSFLSFSSTAQPHKSDHPLVSKTGTHNAHDPYIAATGDISSTNFDTSDPTPDFEAASSERGADGVCYRGPIYPGGRIGEETDQWEVFPVGSMSVIDLLGDEKNDRVPEASPVNEDHVAFSVDGIGRAGSETPVDAPQHQSRFLNQLQRRGYIHKSPHRTFSCGVFSQLRDPSDVDLFVDYSHAPYHHDHSCEVDSILPDFCCGMRPSSLSFSEYTWNSFRTEQETSKFSNIFRNNLEDSRRELPFGCGRSHRWIHQSSKQIWDDLDDAVLPTLHVFPDDDIHGRNCKVSSADCPFKWESDSVSGDSRARYQNLGSLGPVSGDVHLMKKRGTSEQKDDLNILESPAENFSEEIDWLDTVMEYPNNSSSLKSFGSEDSCSSTAVRGKMSNASSLNAGLRNPRNKRAGATWPRIGMSEPEDLERLSIPFKSKISLDSNMHLKNKELFYESDWLLEVPHQVDLDFDSFRGATKKRTACTNSSPWSVEPINASPGLDFYVDDQEPFDQPKHDPDLDSPPHSRKFMSATCAFDKTSRQLNLHNIHGLPKDGSEPTFHSLCSEMKYRDANLSHVASFCGEMPFRERAGPNVQNVSNIQLMQFEEIHFKVEACRVNDLSSESGCSGDGSGCTYTINPVKDDTLSAMESMDTARQLGCSDGMSSSTASMTTNQLEDGGEAETSGSKTIICTDRTEDIDGI